MDDYADDYAEWRPRFARVCLDLFVAVRFASSFRADFATRGAAISFFTRASVVLFDSFLRVFLLMYARCHQLQNNNVQLWTLSTMCLNSTGPGARTQICGNPVTGPNPSLVTVSSQTSAASRKEFRFAPRYSLGNFLSLPKPASSSDLAPFRFPRV